MCSIFLITIAPDWLTQFTKLKHIYNIFISL